MSATPSISDDLYETTHEFAHDSGSATPCAQSWPRSAPCTPAIKALYPLVLQHGLPARPTWVDEWDGCGDLCHNLRSGASSTLTLVAGPDATPSVEGEPKTDDEWMAIAAATPLPPDDKLEVQSQRLVLARDAPDATLHDRQRSAAFSPRPYSPDTLDHLFDTRVAGLLTTAPATAAVAPLEDLPSPPTPPPLTLTPSPDLVVALLHDHVTDLERTQHELHVLAHESCTTAEHLSAQLARQTATADQLVHLARRTAFPDLDPALVHDAPYLARLEDRYRREHAEMMALLADCDAVARNAERASAEAARAREMVEMVCRKCAFEGNVESPEDVDRMVATVMHRAKVDAEAKVMAMWPVSPVDGSVATRAMHVRDTLVQLPNVPATQRTHVQSWIRFMRDVVDEVRRMDRAVAHERTCRAEVEAMLEAKEMEAQQAMRRVEDLQLEMDRVLVETEDIVRRSEVEMDELYDRLENAESRANEGHARAQEEEARRGRVEAEWQVAVRESERRMAVIVGEKGAAQADTLAARAQLEEERARNRDLQRELDEERARTRSLQPELDKERARTRNLQHELDEGRAMTRSVQHELDEERARTRVLQHELDSMSEQLQRATTDLDAHVTKSTGTADRLAAATDHVRWLEISLAETTERSTTLKSELGQATCALATARADLAATQGTLSTTQADLAATKTAFSTAQSDLAARATDLDRARNALRVARRSLLSQSRARSDLQAVLNAALEARQRAEQERDTALVGRDAAIAERDSAVLECVQMTREWRSELAQLETDVRSVQQNESAELDRVRGELEASRAQVATLEVKLAAVKRARPGGDLAAGALNCGRDVSTRSEMARLVAADPHGHVRARTEPAEKASARMPKSSSLASSVSATRRSSNINGATRTLVASPTEDDRTWRHRCVELEHELDSVQDRLRDTERSLQQCSAERDASQLIQAALRAQLQHWRAQSEATAEDAEDRSAWPSVPAAGGGARAAVAAVVKKGLGRMLGSGV
ncbi:hypothetical protein AMAG_10408 [Allomyces macrogynus ATCC 38327]|uniref:Uncharacterized protein n=1 Tax=Allomyces macrogynus (strain ATCC 38327) TaxID=578462 RepID=A0A0L0SUA8_ALLM3|nr:hypothetical protein AMAG_10408 [Allomyces macrogynus ATCC 38327]|eukprot:KNE66158.1 hypothetical protein AMAG_10408 [Allomyces macrogynus ATCC 38327]